MTVVTLFLYVTIFLSFFIFRNVEYVIAIIGTVGVICVIVEKLLGKGNDNRKIICYKNLIFVGFLYSLYTKKWIFDEDAWLRNNLYMYIGVCFAIMFNHVFSITNTLKGFKYLMISVISIHSIIGLFEVITKKYYFTTNTLITDSYALSRYPLSFFYNTNDLATFLLFGIIYLLYFDEEKIKKKYRQLFIVFRNLLLVNSVLLIYLSDSRINLAMVIITFVINILFNDKRTKNTKILFSFFGILIAIVLVVISYTQVDVSSIVMNDASGYVRKVLIDSGLELLRMTDYRGVGAGNISYYLINNRYLRPGQIVVLHNWWMEILATYGLVFFIIYVLYFIKSLYKSFTGIISNQDRINRLCFTWLVVFIVASAASSTIFDDAWIWMVNAFVFCYIDRNFDKNIIKDGGTK